MANKPKAESPNLYTRNGRPARPLDGSDRALYTADQLREIHNDAWRQVAAPLAPEPPQIGAKDKSKSVRRR